MLTAKLQSTMFLFPHQLAAIPIGSSVPVQLAASSVHFGLAYSHS
jgi:hypothetical protein